MLILVSGPHRLGRRGPTSPWPLGGPYDQAAILGLQLDLFRKLRLIE